MSPSDIRLTSYDLRTTFKIDPEGAWPKAGGNHRDRRHGGHAGDAAARALDPRDCVRTRPATSEQKITVTGRYQAAT